MLDDIVIGHEWRAELLMHPTAGSTNADVETLLTGATPYIELQDASGNVVLSATAGTATPSTRVMRWVLVAATTGNLSAGQVRVVPWLVLSSGGPISVTLPDRSADILVNVRVR